MKLKLWFYRRLENFFGRVEDAAGKARWRFSYCSNCGQNRYSGPPCIWKSDKEKEGK
jgi:hypothetical protein